MQKQVYEIFEEVEYAPTRQDKINVIKYNKSFVLASVLSGMFDPRIVFDVEIPEKYECTDIPGMGYSTLSSEIGRLYIFEKNHPMVPPTLTQERKKVILTQILEALEEKEAKVLVDMLHKKCYVKGLDYDMVKEAIPGILP